MLDNVEGVDFLPFADHEQVISPDEARPESVILFDDVACEKTGSYPELLLYGST